MWNELLETDQGHYSDIPIMVFLEFWIIGKIKGSYTKRVQRLRNSLAISLNVPQARQLFRSIHFQKTMNIIAFFENFFGFGKKPATPVAPSEFQGAINTVGLVIDQFETGLTTLQAAAQFLPPAFQGYVAALAVTVHSIDGFVDTLETPTATPVAPSPVTPAT